MLAVTAADASILTYFRVLVPILVRWTHLHYVHIHWSVRVVCSAVLGVCFWSFWAIWSSVLGKIWARVCVYVCVYVTSCFLMQSGMYLLAQM